MQLLLLNGSPRGTQSNTKILLDSFIEGLGQHPQLHVDVHYLCKESNHKSAYEAFIKAQKVILAYPLYTDAMPGIVMKFLTLLQPLTESKNNPDMGFLVQSGFPEAAHSKFVERYHNKLCRRLGAKYLGTVIKGGVEGIKIKPAWMIKSTLEMFRNLGKHFTDSGSFDPTLLKEIEKPILLSSYQRFIYTLLEKIGLMNFYWNSQMKANNALDKNFAQPYVKEK